MEFIIAILVIILCLYITGYFLKKKYFKEIDRLEAWKIDIMNRPVLEEMRKVKKLNMNGQTEELFEKWRKDWDDILTTGLPDVEEYLFDAEEYIDKYRFSRAKQMQNTIENQLNDTEDKIKALLDEINDLVGSEEKNRVEIEELKEIYRLSKKRLLAHRNNYGNAEKKLELKLDEVIASFQQYDELTSSGNYLSAREQVLSIKGLLQEINEKMDIIPNLLVECHSKIPNQLDELKDGYKEMLQQGYVLEHIQFEKEIERLEKELNLYRQQLEDIETEEAEAGIDVVKQSIELIYDLLEGEVKAKQFILSNEQGAKEMLEVVQKNSQELRNEVQTVRQSYHLNESKLEEQLELEKQIEKLVKRYEILEHKIHMDETAYSLLRTELNEMKEQLEAIESDLKVFSENLKMLRSDEHAAREKVQELSRKINEAIKLVTHSNIPGLPQNYLVLVDDAEDSIKDVKEKLEEKPLDIPAVQSFLDKAIESVEKTYDTTKDLVETVVLAEKVIQYGNRYRSRYPSVDRALKEAEMSFRGYDYHSALEQAATAIEEIEPGALKKIENLIEEEVF